jgi:hypothetical protein
VQKLYFVLAAFHILAVVVTGILWTVLDVYPQSRLRREYKDIRAVHFGSLWIICLLLGLAYAFDKLQVPPWHQVFFPAGLGLLVFFSGLGYLFPKPEGLDPFYYWTRGIPLVLALIGIGCIVVCLLWTAAVLVIYSVPG